MTRTCWSILRPGLLLLGIGVSGGCAHDTTGPAPVPPDRLYTQLTIDQHAVTLTPTAPNNTVQLTASPYAATGTVLQDTSTTIWTSSDTTSVQVSPTGLLTAIAPTMGLLVIASRQIGLITNLDTTVVNVNSIATPVPVASQITLTPTTCIFGSPEMCNLNEVFAFVPTVFDQQGDTMANVAVRIRSETPPVLIAGYLFAEAVNVDVWNSGANVNWQTFMGGTAVVVADATVYGTHVTDTIALSVPWPQQRLIAIVPRAQGQSPAFIPSEDTIGVGGVAIWQSKLPGTTLADVVFDDSSAAQAVDSATFLSGNGLYYAGGIVIPNEGGGNIRPFTPLDTAIIFGNPKVIAAARARRFTVAGTYRYHSTLYGTTGILHVVQ